MTATTGTPVALRIGDWTTRAALSQLLRAVTSMDTDIAKEPSSTKNKELVVSKKKRTGDINPRLHFEQG
jgi:hypothetical protein